MYIVTMAEQTEFQRYVSLFTENNPLKFQREPIRTRAVNSGKKVNIFRDNPRAPYERVDRTVLVYV